MKPTWYDTLKYWNGKEILRECKDKNRLCVHANVWNTCVDKPCEKGSKLLGKEADQFIIDEANAYTKGEKMTNIEEHDGCKDCAFEGRMYYQSPCSDCKQNYTDKWRAKPIKKEFTEEYLIKVFEDKFQGRRAISLDEVKEVTKEIFK